MNRKINYDFEKRMLSIEECQSYIGLGKNSTRKLMKDIGAERKIGSRCLYDKHVIDNYLDSFISGENNVQYINVPVGFDICANERR
jgi:hypothetical protein